jgi:riboflavin synthase
MFTGLVESVGLVTASAATPAGRRVRVQTALADRLRAGESVAVNGVCLTVARVEGQELEADVGHETLRATTLGALTPGRPVNLERAMAADGRFGGHLVQGHVDGTGVVDAIWREGDVRWLKVRYPRPLAPWVVQKGSIAVDGISLTVARLDEAAVEIMIVPVTWERTNLPTLAIGELVNLECDMVGKYVARAVQIYGAPVS